MRVWLEDSGISEGPVFRPIQRGSKVHAQPLSDKAVALVVKPYATAEGLYPVVYSGHSLRAGLVTSAACFRSPERDHAADGAQEHRHGVALGAPAERVQ
jgi:hypothetical protein